MPLQQLYVHLFVRSYPTIEAAGMRMYGHINWPKFLETALDFAISSLYTVPRRGREECFLTAC
jgi:hypothetical protein